MKQKKSPEDSSESRRKTIEADVAAYLAAGNKIDEVPTGVSSQDPQGGSKQLRLGPSKAKQEAAKSGKN